MPFTTMNECTECGISGEQWDLGRYGMCVTCADNHDNYDASDDYADDYGDYSAEDVEDGRGIYSYDYKPDPHFYGGRDGWHMGFELEISANTYDTTPIYQWAETHGCEGLLYCKEDGSVDGFEIVSHPMTAAYFDSVPWDDFFGMLEAHWPLSRGNEPRGHGLHVHVSRTAFPRLSTLARWSYMLNHYEEHVCRVARRSGSNWARFSPNPVSMCLPYENHERSGYYVDGDSLECGCCFERTWVETLNRRTTHQFQSIGYPERYQAVNLTNQATVEVRVFRSTRKVEEFVSSVHFVAATVDFVRSMQPWHATRDALAWETFTDYVASHPVFMAEREILTGTLPDAVTGLPSAQEIREWARGNGFNVGRRGRISDLVRDAFADTHSERIYSALANSN